MAPSYRDSPELFVRWFQYNVFTPTLRIHGQRQATAIWDYGTAAEPVLAASLRLREEWLLPTWLGVRDTQQEETVALGALGAYAAYIVAVFMLAGLYPEEGEQ